MLNQLKDVFASLQSNNVRYLVIGGIAAVLYGVPRATFDLDLLIEATSGNAQNLIDALLVANLGTASLTTANDLLAHEITIFQDRVRIDVQTHTPGIEFESAWMRRMEMLYKGQLMQVGSKNDLIVSKIASGGKVDLEDVRLLTLGDSAPE
jgi:hypothetical protein